MKVRTVWVDSGEGPWDTAAEAEEFAAAEVGCEWKVERSRVGVFSTALPVYRLLLPFADAEMTEEEEAHQEEEERERARWEWVQREMVEMRTAVDQAGHCMEIVHEVLTGRDTHPLTVGGEDTQQRFYIAMEAQRISDQVEALKNYLHNELTTLEGMVR